MLQEKCKSLGEVHFELRDEHGNVKQSFSKNLLVGAGLGHLTSRLLNTSQGILSHMAVGSGAVAPVSGNTGLGSELGRVAFATFAQATTTTANDAIQATATFPAGTGTGAITEAGLFNAASAGTMFSRTVFPVINKGALDSLSITWKVTFT